MVNKNSTNNEQIIYERIGKNEEKLFQHDRRIQILEEDKKAINEMSSNIAILTEMYKQQSEINEKQSDQMDKVNENLTEMSKSLIRQNSIQESVQKELENQGEEIKTQGERLTEIERDKAISKFFINMGKIVITGIVISLITYVLKTTTGLEFKF